MHNFLKNLKERSALICKMPPYFRLLFVAQSGLAFSFLKMLPENTFITSCNVVEKFNNQFCHVVARSCLFENREDGLLSLCSSAKMVADENRCNYLTIVKRGL